LVGVGLPCCGRPSRPSFEISLIGQEERLRKGVFSNMSYYAPTAARARPRFSLLFVIYIAAGAVVSASHHYWAHLNTIKQIGSALLATVLWPLILLGINLHIH
jgi:hypothetical protein